MGVPRHEKTRERLREMLQKRGFQPPSRAETQGVVCQVVIGQAIDLSEVDDESLPIVIRCGQRGKQVQALDSAFQDLVPTPLARRLG